MPPVLVVDDDEDCRNSMSYLLETEGYAVIGAADGQQALDILLEGGRPCLILLDLLMPVMDGIAFLSALERYPQLGDIPIYLLSAASAAAPRREIPRLPKPISVDKLLAVVHRHYPPATPGASLA